MPIRIREIHIKATVSDEKEASWSKNDSGDRDQNQNQQTLIAMCVEQVLRRLKTREER